MGFGKIQKFGKISNGYNFQNKRDAVILRPFLGSLWLCCVYRDHREMTEYVFQPFFYKSMLIPKPAKVHFWFLFSNLIFVYFNAIFEFFWIKQKETKLFSLCTGFLNFENCLSITGAKTKTDGGARTRYIYIYLSIYIYIYIDIYRYIYI